MQTLKMRGHWWRPNADERVTGTLDVSRHAVAVDLDAPIAEWRQEGPNLVRHLGVTKYPIIHGELEDGRFVTLVECSTGLAIAAATRLRAQYCLVGLFVIDDAAVVAAQVELDWLDSWVDHDVVQQSDEAIIVPIGPPAPAARADLDNDVTVFLAAGIDGEHSERRVDLTRRTYFGLDFGQPCDLATVVSDYVRPLQDFATVALGRAVRVTRILVEVRDPSPVPGLLYECLCSISQADDEPELDVAALQSFDSPTLVSGEQLTGTFETLLPAWFAGRQKYFGAVSKLNAPSFARFMYLENHAAVTVQAVEALHKIEFDTHELPKAGHAERHARAIEVLEASDLPEEWVAWASRVLKNRNDVSINDQIAHVMTLAGGLGTLIANEVDGFTAGAADLRHLSSHGSGKVAPRSQDDIERAHYLIELVKWVLRVAILGLIGAPDVDTTAMNTHALRFAVARLSDLGARPPKAAKKQ